MKSGVGVWEDMGSSYLNGVNNFWVKHLALRNVIFTVKMAPVHKVWSWSLGGEGVILTRVGMPGHLS